AGAEGTRLGRDLDTVADLCFFGAATRAVHDAGRLPGFAAGALGTRYLMGFLVEVALTFRHARRPVIATRRWGALLRAGGLAVAAAGGRRTGGALSTLGCLALPTRAAAASAAPARTGPPSPLRSAARSEWLMWRAKLATAEAGR